MKSDAANVGSYIAGVPSERRAAIKKLRALCRRNLVDFDECIDYGMPCYKRNGVLEVAFASQKRYIALYVQTTAVVEDFRKKLAASIGKSCIRFSSPDKMDFEVIEQLLRTVKSKL